MADHPLQATIEDDYETELSRLGSSKALYALTEGEMATGAVLEALTDAAATAAETFVAWAEDEANDDLFVRAAEVARGQADRLADAAPDATPTDSPTPADEVLRGLDGSEERLGGLLAWALIADRTYAQAVGFFVGNADTQAADLFRELRSDVDDLRADAAADLADADGGPAREAASEVVEAAYDHYVATLEGMGVKVKPVC